MEPMSGLLFATLVEGGAFDRPPPPPVEPTGKVVARAVRPDGTPLWTFFSVASAREWLRTSTEVARLEWVR
jgi:hypothetical protein